MLKAGIVGLPNVGKSTLFNALVANAQAQAANFPFCTIEPNVGTVAVPDERLDRLTELSTSQDTIPTRMEFVDIAGLVKGASQGEGLGNKFLANIREVDAIVHVIRCFEEPPEALEDLPADMNEIQKELAKYRVEVMVSPGISVYQRDDKSKILYPTDQPGGKEITVSQDRVETNG